MEQSRKLINAYQFNNEPLRILLASLGNGLRATDAFLASTLSKHLLREIKLADAAVKKPDAIRWNTTLRRYGLGTGKGGDGDEVDEEDEAPREGSVVSAEKARLPTKANPVNVAVYGQICLAAKSYQSALCRLSHLVKVSLLTYPKSTSCTPSITALKIRSSVCVWPSHHLVGRCNVKRITGIISSLR